MLHKTVTVETSDKKNPVARLEISGKIEKFATIVPASVRLSGPPGKPVVGEVKIIPQEKYPFSVTEAKALDGKNILIKLEEVTKPPEKGYVLHIENTKKDAGRYRDTIVLKTTSKIKPELEIRVYGNIFDPNSKPTVHGDQNLQKFLDAIKNQQQKNAKDGGGQVEKKNPSVDGQKFFEQLIKQNQQMKQEPAKTEQEPAKPEQAPAKTE